MSHPTKKIIIIDIVLNHHPALCSKNTQVSREIGIIDVIVTLIIIIITITISDMISIAIILTQLKMQVRYHTSDRTSP